MSYTVKIKDGDSKYQNGGWVDSDEVTTHPELADAMLKFLMAIEDGYEPVTLKYKPTKNKEGKTK